MVVVTATLLVLCVKNSVMSYQWLLVEVMTKYVPSWCKMQLAAENLHIGKFGKDVPVKSFLLLCINKRLENVFTQQAIR